MNVPTRSLPARVRAVWSVLALMVALAHPMHANGQAQVGDDGPLVTTCDALAAHGSDRTRTAEGVSDTAMVPVMALVACENAAKDLPGNQRILFQLGRSQAGAGRIAEAFQSYKRAADLGHVVASGFTGDAYLAGRGVAANIDMARRYYQKAADGGFEAANVMLDAITFDPGIFIGALLPVIYQGMAGLTENMDLRRQDPLLGYVYGFVSILRSDCRAATKPVNVLVLLRLRARKDFTGASLSNPEISVLALAGEMDAQSFVQRHGCDGPVAARVFDNLNAYINLHTVN